MHILSPSQIKKQNPWSHETIKEAEDKEKTPKL